MRHTTLASCAIGLLCAACAQNPISPAPSGHITAEAANPPPKPIPAPVRQTFDLPPPQPTRHEPKLSVVANNLPAGQVLFNLARDAKLNVDVHPGISGNVTLNALNQTLPQLLERIARQVDMRWEMLDETLVVMPDSPFLRHYQVDYVNLARDTSGNVAITTEVAATGGVGADGKTPINTGAASNSSSTRIENLSRNRFWDTLIQNLKDLLRETDRLVPVADPTAAAGKPESSRNAEPRVTYREAAAVIANPETGVISVRASARQHERVREFIDRVTGSAQRQVLIEATIAEVQLSENYQQGIDWTKLNLSGSGFKLVQNAAGALAAPDSHLFELSYASKGGSFSGAVRLLDSFGTAKVLSSPKVSVLNNQTAVLKVVDNEVYFVSKVENTTNENFDKTVFSTEVHSVPIGLVLSVTPQVGERDTVVLNIRPTLSRIVGQVADPNPELKKNGIVSQIPIVRSREIDSMIRVEDGNVAIMGGLMEDALDLNKDTVPVAAGMPFLGGLFQNRNDNRRKSELVILLRPTIIRRASLAGDYSAQRERLPSADFFKGEAGPTLFNLDALPGPSSPAGQVAQ